MKHNYDLRLKNDGGFTLKNFKMITYKTGYQVATEGVECTTAAEVHKAIKAFGGDCGVWKYNGIYYVDKSHREPTKKKALEVGRAHNQISVLRWADFKTILCNN